MNTLEDFTGGFRALTGHTPFPWQRKLFSEFNEMRFRTSIDLPTGLGKTSILAIWLLAMARRAQTGAAPGFPRRLVYVVNRRTVVDQATSDAEDLRRALTERPELEPVAKALRSLATRVSIAPFAISSLRGQFADNAEWRDDPARPAVIVGTVDMIGSRLLFSGYGRGFKSRPLHAAFLGQDVLLVHDEAHLEPAFQRLVTAIKSEQERTNDFRFFRVVEMTATTREASPSDPLLSEEDRRNPEVQRRVEARKRLTFHRIEDEKRTADRIVELVVRYKDSGQAILVFLRKLEHVAKVSRELGTNRFAVQTLTGTLRGRERDELAKGDPVFARFMPDPKVAPQPGTVVLVATSAGEVGVNMSADHLVCDLSPFDSMAQRLGRVNRFGAGDADIDIVHSISLEEARKLAAEVSGLTPDGVAEGEQGKAKKAASAFEESCARTLVLLSELPKRKDGHDASPRALAALPAAERIAAFSPQPITPMVSDILFDAWALTSIRQPMPGRPQVADWLHGISDWEPPETHVAWREEVEFLTADLRSRYDPEDLLEDYPLKPHEVLRDRSDRVFSHLEALGKREPDKPVWLVEPGGAVRVTTLADIVDDGKEQLFGRTILLSPAVGGLAIDGNRCTGMLDGHAAFAELSRAHYDVSAEWLDEDGSHRRCRVWDDAAVPAGMRLVRTIAMRLEPEEVGDAGEESAARRRWHWYVRPRAADDDGSRSARREQDLEPHRVATERFAQAIAQKLGLFEANPLEAKAIVLAARAHDLGKDRAVWQRSIGNRSYPARILAKSGGRMLRDVSRYRHEFGSLFDVLQWEDFRTLEPDAQDLVLHLIAAHHGRARPHFPVEEVFDPNHTEQQALVAASEVPRRFSRLQRRYGRWGLAYLESLVRSADALASQELEGPGALAGSENREASR